MIKGHVYSSFLAIFKEPVTAVGDRQAKHLDPGELRRIVMSPPRQGAWRIPEGKLKCLRQKKTNSVTILFSIVISVYFAGPDPGHLLSLEFERGALNFKH